MRFDFLIAVFIAAWALVLLVPPAILTSVGTLAAIAAALLLVSAPRRRASGADVGVRAPGQRQSVS